MTISVGIMSSSPSNRVTVLSNMPAYLSGRFTRRGPLVLFLALPQCFFPAMLAVVPLAASHLQASRLPVPPVLLFLLPAPDGCHPLSHGELLLFFVFSSLLFWRTSLDSQMTLPLPLRSFHRRCTAMFRHHEKCLYSSP